MSTIRRSLSALAVAAACAMPASAHAVGTPVIVSGPGSYITNYTQPVAVAQPGDDVLYVNADAQPHDVVARTFGPDTAAYCDDDIDPFQVGVQRRFPVGGCPVFWTPLITIGQQAPVQGLDNVQGGPRIYDFFCTIHGNMEGQLVVL